MSHFNWPPCVSKLLYQDYKFVFPNPELLNTEILKKLADQGRQTTQLYTNGKNGLKNIITPQKATYKLESGTNSINVFLNIKSYSTHDQIILFLLAQR